MAHQQLRRFLGQSMNALDVSSSGRGRLDLVLPVVTEVVGQILLQGLTAVELLHTHRTHDRVIGQLAHFVFHRGIDEIEISHQLAVTGLVDDAFQEAADETSVLGHGVSLFGAFAELSGQCDGHGTDS